MHVQEEMEEVEAKLTEAEHSASHSAVRAFFAQFCTPVFLEAVVLTFLGGAPPCAAQCWQAAQRCANLAASLHFKAVTCGRVLPRMAVLAISLSDTLSVRCQVVASAASSVGPHKPL